jgi:hypothetical protein
MGNLTESDHLEDLFVYRRIIKKHLKQIRWENVDWIIYVAGS